jgi:hypothetical protein
MMLFGTNSAASAQNLGDRTNLSACERDLKKLGPPRWGEKITPPIRTDHRRPAYPPIPRGTKGGGVWVGEILIDAQGSVSKVWTIRELKLTPPVRSLNGAITDAVSKWEFVPAAVDNVPVPVCRTVSVNVNLNAIRTGRAYKVPRS